MIGEAQLVPVRLSIQLVSKSPDGAHRHHVSAVEHTLESAANFPPITGKPIILPHHQLLNDNSAPLGSSELEGGVNFLSVLHPK